MPEVRLIDANALIKNIAESIRLADEWEKESHEKKDKHGIKCAIDTRRALMAMISRVKEAPTIKPEVRHGRWIPCSERLPDSKEDVLVWFEYYRYGEYNCLYQTYGIGNYNKNYSGWMVNHETGWNQLRVIAWMLMPEPPGGGAEDE